MTTLIQKCRNFYNFFPIFNLFKENRKYRLLVELMIRSRDIQNEELFKKCFEKLRSNRFGKVYCKWDDENTKVLLRKCEYSDLYFVSTKYCKNIYLIFRRDNTIDLIIEGIGSYNFYHP